MIMKLLATILFFFLFLTGAFAQTRNVLVNTSSVVVQPTNFWSADASNARSGLGLGSAATNPASSFQSSSSVLSNLASSNAINLTNIRATNIVGSIALASNVSGIVSIANGGTGGTTAGEARTNLNAQQASVVLSNLANSNGGNLTNLNISNLGTILITGGGTGATNAATARTNLGIGATWLTNTNMINFLKDLGLHGTGQDSFIGLGSLNIAASSGSVVGGGVANTATNNFTTVSGGFQNKALFEFATVGGGSGNNATNTNVTIAGGVNNIASGYGATIGGGILNEASGYGATVVGGNYNVASGNYAVAMGESAKATNNRSFVFSDNSSANFSSTNTNSFNISAIGGMSVNLGTNGIIFRDSNSASATRTNLGLGSFWLTNTNNPVFVSTNGEVVSPTNFWQVAPIQTLVQTFTPVINSTNAATNARNLYVYSLATNIVNVTNIITLPTNTSAFDGDTATITHNGATSSVTAVRQLGSAINFTTISNNAESVKFIREAGQWTFYHNISFVEPIRFTDGDIEINKAASRTNLGLGFAALTNTNTTNFQAAIFNTNTNVSNGGSFASLVTWMEVNVITNGVPTSFRIPLFK